MHSDQWVQRRMDVASQRFSFFMAANSDFWCYKLWQACIRTFFQLHFTKHLSAYYACKDEVQHWLLRDLHEIAVFMTFCPLLRNMFWRNLQSQCNHFIFITIFYFFLNTSFTGNFANIHVINTVQWLITYQYCFGLHSNIGFFPKAAIFTLAQDLCFYQHTD